MSQTLLQQFPDLYLNGATPGLIDFINAVLAQNGMSGNPDITNQLVMVVKEYIAEGGT